MQQKHCHSSTKISDIVTNKGPVNQIWHFLVRWWQIEHTDLLHSQSQIKMFCTILHSWPFPGPSFYSLDFNSFILLWLWCLWWSACKHSLQRNAHIHTRHFDTYITLTSLCRQGVVMISGSYVTSKIIFFWTFFFLVSILCIFFYVTPKK